MEINMQKNIAASLAAVGIAAAVVIPSVHPAQARNYRDDRADRAPLSVSQNIDRADARIAVLKAELRMTDDQAMNWSGIETALRDIATKRAKAVAELGNPQSGRSASDSRAATMPLAASQDADMAARRERVARANPQQDDIAALQRESEVLASESADLKQIADAAKPLYDSLDNRQRQRLVQFIHDDMRVNQADQWRSLRR
jgi:hypothetical protein